MMKLNFTGNLEGIRDGINLFADRLNFSVSEDGTNVHVAVRPVNAIKVAKDKYGASISFKEKIHFFRALGLLVEALRDKDEFTIMEEPQFQTIGVMFDVSQGNAVINKENIKKILDKMAVMGLNMLMLYTEDSYEIASEPYFGYMRGRYTFDEIKECDDYADMLGIEMIPCIQTLAHLIDALKWNCYDDIREDDDTLLVGSDKTYEFIEKMIASVSAPYRSKRIHIGMDEAWKLGRGKYMDIHGYREKFDIMVEHLNRILCITNRYGLKPMMFSDMFFKSGSSTGAAYDSGKVAVITPEMAGKIPIGMQLVYWNYKHHSEPPYKMWLERHKKLRADTIFAGGIWSWNGFGVDYDKTFATTIPALNACKEEGIKEVIATIWGDGGTESNLYSNLLGLQLFAEHGYSGNFDLDKLKTRFQFCTGASYDSFMEITYLDKLHDTKPVEGFCFTNPSKYLLWQDLLMGLFDKNAEGLNLPSHYAILQKHLESYVNSSGEFGFLFSFLGKLSSILSVKADMGLKITEAYKDKNHLALHDIVERELPELYKRVENLRTYHRELWFAINKPFGWEILDIRYGGLLARINSAMARIASYLAGDVSHIEELDQERLYFTGVPGLIGCNMYSKMPSASRLSFSFYF